jgi:hypothetical protein
VIGYGRAKIVSEKHTDVLGSSGPDDHYIAMAISDVGTFACCSHFQIHGDSQLDSWQMMRRVMNDAHDGVCCSTGKVSCGRDRAMLRSPYSLRYE